ncbi:hypothetical protein AVEN_120086-1 [Araneus ventricosus]|uniref:Uncharacterized protein n=1 Tax=Araneus ventricosus TaxID=182803 RepID=A0A4Y2G4L6_ARAVE|nr:hypothetical protein AVEN_120086-1 [Araneus ventricosus]
MQVSNVNNTSKSVPIQKGSFRTQTAMRKSVSNALVLEISKFRKIVCPLCGDCHLLYQCPRIQKLTAVQRWSLVRKKRLCINFLRPNHFVSKCLFTDRCKTCQGKHHIIHHQKERKSAVQSAIEEPKTLLHERKVEQERLVDQDKKPGLLLECKSKD